MPSPLYTNISTHPVTTLSEETADIQLTMAQQTKEIPAPTSESKMGKGVVLNADIWYLVFEQVRACLILIDPHS